MRSQVKTLSSLSKQRIFLLWRTLKSSDEKDSMSFFCLLLLTTWKAPAKYSELSLGSDECGSVETGVREVADHQWELGDEVRTEWCQMHHMEKN